MNGAGLDISTKFLDFVILNTEHPSECEHRRVELATEDGRWWESARGMYDAFDDFHSYAGLHYEDTLLGWFYEHDVTLLGIERPYGPSRQAIASLHTILGAVLATIPSHITVLEVRPAEMRKALGLKGNVSKEEMHAGIGKVNGWANIFYRGYPTNWPPDALDAWAVAWAAYRLCEKAAA